MKNTHESYNERETCRDMSIMYVRSLMNTEMSNELLFMKKIIIEL